MPLPERTKKVTLEGLGSDYSEYWFEFRRMAWMPITEVEELFKPRGNDNGNLWFNFRESFAELIIAWNIPDATTGESLPIPTKENMAETVDRIPKLFADFISQVMLQEYLTVADEKSIVNLAIKSVKN